MNGFGTLFAAAIAQAAAPAARVAPADDVVVEEGTIAMPDGVALAHTFFHPRNGAPWPLLLSRTCYGKGDPAARRGAKGYVAQGCAVLVQDVRGTGRSSGVFTPFADEARDGAATVDWVLAQPWCDGRIATHGTSYLGITAWQLAPHAGDHLVAASLHFTSADLYRDVVHFGGVQGLAALLQWSETVGGASGAAEFRKLPLIEADDASGKDLPVWKEWCRHVTLDDYWKPMDFAPRYAQVKAPALLVAGWYDLFQPGQLDDYMQLAKRTGAPEKSFARVVVGPWDHGGPAAPRAQPGRDAPVMPGDEEDAFFQRFVLGKANGFEKKAGARVFLLGEEKWRDFASWPPPAARRVALDLESGGHAEQKPGDGTLLEESSNSGGESPAATAPLAIATRAPFDAFVYDPKNPCPSYAASLWKPTITMGDQFEIAQRDDVLVYVTAPLAKDVVVAGPVELELWIESDAPDADFAAKLVDVGPDAESAAKERSDPSSVEWRGEGIQRARTRDSVYAEKLLVPGEPTRLVVRMGHMAARFAAGHRIGLHVTSSNFPRFSRNLGTAEPSNVATKPRVCHQKVLHDPQHVSALRLWLLAESH
jgi:putative CocE/NonD family hydrolase